MATNITNEADLQACYLDPTEDYTVTADITLTGDFTSYCITNYSGTFDGGNYTITDLAITATANTFGMFKGLNAAGTIQNLKFSNIATTFGAYRYVGSLVGDSRGTIDNVHMLSGTQTYGRYEVGVFIGRMLAGIIKNCTNNVTISNNANYRGIGGIVGVTAGPSTIEDCENTGFINSSGSWGNGGILGYAGSTTTITRCNNSGTVYSANGVVGGIAGAGSGIIYMTDCDNSGAVYSSTAWYVGGIISTATNANSTYTNCDNTGVIGLDAAGNRAANYTGAIVGKLANGTFDNCNNTAMVYGNGYAGSMVGQAAGGTFKNSTNTGELFADGANSRGFVGYNAGGTFEDCANIVDITSSSSVGGFTATMSTGSISRCYYKGTITITTNSWDRGGFIGYMINGTITDCYADATFVFSAVPANYCGGFVGRKLNGNIYRSYAAANAETSADHGGGFAGINNSGNIENCYSTGTYSADTSNGGMFCGTNNGIIANCGCRTSAIYRDIGSPAGDVTYSKTDPTEWYSKTEGVYTVGTYPWDFTTPVWYDHIADYPDFIPDTVVMINSSIFFGCHF